MRLIFDPEVTGYPAPPGVISDPLRVMLPFSAPQGPFAGIGAGANGTLRSVTPADRDSRRPATVVGFPCSARHVRH